VACSWASFYGFKNILVQPFLPDRPIIALDIRVLLRVAGLNILDLDPHFFSPRHQLATDVFRTVIHPNNQWFTAPFDDPVQV